MQKTPGGVGTSSHWLAMQSARWHSSGLGRHWAGRLHSGLPVVIGMVVSSVVSVVEVVVVVSGGEVEVEVSALELESSLDEVSGPEVCAGPELLVGTAEVVDVVDVVDGSGAPVVTGWPVEVDESPVLVVVPALFGMKQAGRQRASARGRPRVAGIDARYHASRCGCAQMGMQRLSLQMQQSAQPPLSTQSRQLPWPSH